MKNSKAPVSNNVRLSEVPGTAASIVADSTLLLLSDSKLRRMARQESDVIGTVSLEQPSRILVRGETFVIQSDGTGRQETRAISQPDTVLETVELVPSLLTAGNRKISKRKTKSRQDCLCSTDESGNSVSKVYLDPPVFATDERLVFLRTREGLVECLAPDLQVIWSRHFPRRHSIGYGAVEPMPTGDGVIVLLGSDPGGRQRGEIVKLSKATGHTVWSRVFDSHPSDCFLRENRLYLTEGQRLGVLDTETGKTVMETRVGPPDLSDARVWAEGNNVYVFSQTALRVFSERGTLLDDWRLPEPYVFRLRDRPMAVDQYAYVLARAHSEFKLIGTATALVQIPLDASEPKDREPTPIRAQTIEPERWPVEAHVYSIRTETSVRYHVTVRGSSIDEMTRYGSILLRWVAWARGWSSLSEFRRNRKFDGTIYISHEGGRDESAAFEEMLERIRQAIEKFNEPFAGDRKGRIDFKVVPMPEGPTGIEEPIGSLITPFHIREDAYVEKLPVGITVLAAHAMRSYRGTYSTTGLAEKLMKQVARGTDSGTLDLLRESAGLAKQQNLVAAYFPKAVGSPSSTEVIDELREGAVWCYANIGWLFYSEQDCQNWFRALSKLARGICRKAPQEDEAIVKLYNVVDELAEVGRVQFEDRKARGEFSYVPPWEARS